MPKGSELKKCDNTVWRSLVNMSLNRKHHLDLLSWWESLPNAVMPSRSRTAALLSMVVPSRLRALILSGSVWNAVSSLEGSGGTTFQSRCLAKGKVIWQARRSLNMSRLNL